MTYLWAAGLILINAVWLALVVLGLPGNWLMVLCTALLAWWRWDASGGGMFSLWTLGAILVLASLGEVLELCAGVIGTKTTGGSRWGSVGALAGGLIGAVAGTFLIPVPFIGSLLGAAGGAGAGAWILELAGGRTMEASVKAGVGAGVGRFAGTILKVIVGAAIWLVAAVAAFWP